MIVKNDCNCKLWTILQNKLYVHGKLLNAKDFLLFYCSTDIFRSNSISIEIYSICGKNIAIIRKKTIDFIELIETATSNELKLSIISFFFYVEKHFVTPEKEPHQS